MQAGCFLHRSHLASCEERLKLKLSQFHLLVDSAARSPRNGVD